MTIFKSTGRSWGYNFLRNDEAGQVEDILRIKCWTDYQMKYIPFGDLHQVNFFFFFTPESLPLFLTSLNIWELNDLYNL